MSETLSSAELVFAQRMLPHFMAGKSAAEAGQSVLTDDARIFTAFCNRSRDEVVSGTNDHSGHSYRTRLAEGDLIATTITERVYETLKAARS